MKQSVAVFWPYSSPTETPKAGHGAEASRYSSKRNHIGVWSRCGSERVEATGEARKTSQGILSVWSGAYPLSHNDDRQNPSASRWLSRGLRPIARSRHLLLFRLQAKSSRVRPAMDKAGHASRVQLWQRARIEPSRVLISLLVCRSGICEFCAGLFTDIPERCYRCRKLSKEFRTCSACRSNSRRFSKSWSA